MSAIEKLPTGAPGLDVLLHGGLPRGRSTLICGKSGTCKSILSLQIAASVAGRGRRTAFLAVEETPDDLRETGATLGFDIARLEREGLFKIVDLTRPDDGPVVTAGDYDLSGLVHRVEAIVKEFDAEVFALDSATALLSPRPPEEHLRSYFFQLVYGFRRLGMTAIITAEAPTDYGQLTTLGVEDYVCDLVLILRNTVDAERRRRSIEVHKYRRSAHYKGEYPCTMTGRGLIVFPLDVDDGAAAAPETQRFSSGLAGLDDMNSGGWLRDSIVLVRGPSGSGKTTLAGMYARAGAARGEKVVYYGFEETKPILMRNFGSLGMPMEEYERSGRIKIICKYPEATSPEDMLVDLRSSLEKHQPSLIVLDSISSVEHSTSARGFRQFMVGVAALLREHGRSALLTQTTASGTADIDAATPAYLSTIPDAILLLDYDLKTPDLTRSMRVLKMRGSVHRTERHKLTILPGGLKVEPFLASVPA